MTETGEELRGRDQAESYVLSHGKVLDSPEEEFRTVSASPTPTGSSKTIRRASLKHTMVPNTAKYEASPSHRRGSGLIKESIPIGSESLEVMQTVAPVRKKSQPQIEIHTAKTAMTGRRVPVSDGILSKDEGLEREEDSDGIQLFRQLNFSGESPTGGSTWSEKRKTRKRALAGEDAHSSPSRGFEDSFSDPSFSHADSRRRLSHPHATPFESIPSPDSSTYSEASPPSPMRSIPSLPGSLKKASPTSTPMRRSLSPGFHRSFLLSSSSSEMWSPPLALNFDEPAFSKKRSGYRKGLELSDGTDSFLESSTSATHLDSRSKSMGRQSTSTSLPSEKLMVSQSTTLLQRDNRSIASTPSPTSSSTNSTVSHGSSATPSPHVVQIPKFSVTLSSGTSDTSYQSPVATLVRRSQLSPAPQFELRSTQTSSKSSPSLLDFTDSSDYSLTKKIGTAGSSPQLLGTAQSSPQTGKISGASSAAQTPSGILPKDRLVLSPKSLPQSGASSPSPRSEPIQRTSWSTGHKQLKDGLLVLSPDPKAFEDEQTLRRNERARRNSNSAARRRLVTCPPTPERRLPRMGRLPSQAYQPTLATPTENPDPVEAEHVYDRGLNLNLTLEMMGPKKNRKKDTELLPEIETHTPIAIISPTTPQQSKSTTTTHGTPSPPIPTALFPDFSDSTLSLIPDSPAKKFKSEVEDQSDTKQEPAVPLWDSRILGGLEMEAGEGSPSRSVETEEMPASEFNDPQLIGEGAFFEVFRVSDARSGKFYAIKKAKRVFKGERDREDYLKEFRLVRWLGPHPNIIQHYLCWQEEGYFFLQMEYAEDNLRDYVDAKLGGAPSDSFVLKLCRQLAMALDHLHKAGLLHLDIKSENVLVTKDELFKLCDFGQASMKKDWKPGENEGDSQYIAPEVLNGHQDGGLGATPKADIYSLGLLLFQLRTGTELPTGGALWRALRTDESQTKPAELLQDVREKPLTPKFDIDSSFSTPPFRYSTVSERSALTEEKVYGFDDVPEISLTQTLLLTPPSSRRSLAPKHSSKKDSKPSLIALDTHDPSIVCRLFSSPRKPGTEKKSEGLLEFSPEKPVLKVKESKAFKEPKESFFDMESSELQAPQADKLIKVKEEIDGLILSLIHPNPSCRPNAKAVIGTVKQLEAKLEMLIPLMRVSDSPEWLSSGISTMDLGP